VCVCVSECSECVRVCSVKKEVEKCDDRTHSCKLIMIGETHNEISNFTITLILYNVYS
jgi:hypothetical protein